MIRDVAWKELAEAARGFTGGISPETTKALSAAAMRWAQVNKPGPDAQTREAMTLLVPFGKDKGLPLNEAKRANLDWVAEKMRESLDDPAKERWRAQNVTLLEAIERELSTR